MEINFAKRSSKNFTDCQKTNLQNKRKRVTSMKTNNQEHTILGIKQQAHLGEQPRIFFKICKKSFKLKNPARSNFFRLNKKMKKKLSKTAHFIKIAALFFILLNF